MRVLLASAIDVIAACVLTFASFRLAVSVAPCSDLGDCAALGPTVLVLVLAILILYFGGSFALLGTTPGRFLADRNSLENHP